MMARVKMVAPKMQTVMSEKTKPATATITPDSIPALRANSLICGTLSPRALKGLNLALTISIMFGLVFKILKIGIYIFFSGLLRPTLPIYDDL